MNRIGKKYREIAELLDISQKSSRKTNVRCFKDFKSTNRKHINN
jgi:hypothetical protein